MSRPLDVESVLSSRQAYNAGLVDAGRETRARSRGVAWSLLGVLVLLPLVQLSGVNFNYVLHLLLYCFMYVAMASSWNILGGFVGVD
jgi:branched-chain amino acid transport system permease protein